MSIKLAEVAVMGLVSSYAFSEQSHSLEDLFLFVRSSISFFKML